VAFEREERVVVRHAMAVVDDANHAAAAGFGFRHEWFSRQHRAAFSSNSFYGRKRAFDNFASGDFVGDSFREYADAAHLFFWILDSDAQLVELDSVDFAGRFCH